MTRGVTPLPARVEVTPEMELRRRHPARHNTGRGREKATPRNLSARLEQLAYLVSRGSSNKEAAFAMGISEGTVKVYMNRLFKTLRCASRLELALFVRNGGLRRPHLNDRLAAHLAGGCAEGAD